MFYLGKDSAGTNASSLIYLGVQSELDGGGLKKKNEVRKLNGSSLLRVMLRISDLALDVKG